MWDHFRVPSVNVSSEFMWCMETLIICHMYLFRHGRVWRHRLRHMDRWLLLYRDCEFLNVVWPQKLSRSSLGAQRRQNDCLGRSKVEHRMFKHHHGRHGRRGVWTCSKQLHKCRMVAQRLLTACRTEARGSPWLQSGRTMAGQWSPYNKCVLLETLPSVWATLLPRICDDSASSLPPLSGPLCNICVSMNRWLVSAIFHCFSRH